MTKTRKFSRSVERVPMMTLGQVVRWLSISERTIHRYLADGKLRAYKLDGILLFNPADVEEFLKRRRVGGGPTAPFAACVDYKGPSKPVLRPMTDAEAQTFFEDCKQDEDGTLESKSED